MGHKDKGIRNYNPSLAAQQTPAGKSYLNKIRKLEPYERLLYWIKERHAIHVRRFPRGLHDAYTFVPPRGDDWDITTAPNDYLEYNLTSPKETPAPWTDDPILRTVFFCNPYRENDKVTTYLREQFRKPHKGDKCVFLGTILLRWYNYVPTMYRLIESEIPQRFGHPGLKKVGGWPRKAYEELLLPLRDAGEQMFGGAYIIRPVVDGVKGARKVESLGELMTQLARDKELYDFCCENSMADVFDRLTSFKGMGPFYCYQFIGDLAYTHVLENANDWFTWSFCGPGTARGLVRLEYPSGKCPTLPRMFKTRPGDTDKLLDLQKRVNKDLHLSPMTKTERHRAKAGGEVRQLSYIHMRDLTNCLCEYDKYDRALFNERSIKRPYFGSGT